MCQTSQHSQDWLKVTVQRETAVKGSDRVRAELIMPPANHAQGTRQLISLLDDDAAAVPIDQPLGPFESADDHWDTCPEVSGKLPRGQAKSP
jgi:hypothetical protein